MKICKRKYRIVTDRYLGFEVQKKVWYFPFWFQIRCKRGFFLNTNRTIEDSEKLIEMDKTNSRTVNGNVVKTYNCE